MEETRFFTVFIILFILSFVACGNQVEEVRLDAIEKNEAMIFGAEPCNTVDEIRKAGIPIPEEPFGTHKNEEKELESATYLLQKSTLQLNLAGYEVENSFFEFINGKLSNITINLDKPDVYEAVRTEMITLYGEPVIKEAPDATMDIWEFQGDYPVRVGIMGHLSDGKVIGGSFQVSYIWFEEA